MTSQEIAQTLEVITGGYIPKKARQEDCTHLLTGDKYRFCRQTNQKSCNGCRFYSPSIRTKINMVIETIKRMEIEHELAMTNLKSDCEIRMKRMMDQHDRECLALEEEIEFYRTGGTAPMFKKEKKKNGK